MAYTGTQTAKPANAAVNRHYMELQADRIELVLAHHKIPARVHGGSVLPRWLRFNLATAVTTKISKIRKLNEELALALGVNDVRVSRTGRALTIEVPRDTPDTVRLAALMRQLPAIAPATAVLGVADTGQPLLLRFSSPDVAHVLVAGATGSGKTELMRTMLLSMALANRPGQLQLVLIDPKGRGFGPLAGLPHVVGDVITDTDDAVTMLQRLVDEMVRRDEAGTNYPRIVIAIDEIIELIMGGGSTAVDLLTRLAQRGREAGLHLLAGAQKPSSQFFGPQLKANFPVRLVGRVGSASDALVATGVAGSKAEKLLGRGDFLVVAAGDVTRFQAAYATPAQMADLVQQASGTAGRRQ